jgi:hypothetical protein
VWYHTHGGPQWWSWAFPSIVIVNGLWKRSLVTAARLWNQPASVVSIRLGLALVRHGVVLEAVQNAYGEGNINLRGFFTVDYEIRNGEDRIVTSEEDRQ